MGASLLWLLMPAMASADEIVSVIARIDDLHARAASQPGGGPLVDLILEARELLHSQHERRRLDVVPRAEFVTQSGGQVNIGAGGTLIVGVTGTGTSSVSADILSASPAPSGPPTPPASSPPPAPLFVVREDARGTVYCQDYRSWTVSPHDVTYAQCEAQCVALFNGNPPCTAFHHGPYGGNAGAGACGICGAEPINWVEAPLGYTYATYVRNPASISPPPVPPPSPPLSPPSDFEVYGQDTWCSGYFIWYDADYTYEMCEGICNSRATLSDNPCHAFCHGPYDGNAGAGACGICSGALSSISWVAAPDGYTYTAYVRRS